MEAIDHIDLVVSSLQRGLPLCPGLPQPFGYLGEGEIVHRPVERDLVPRIAELEAGVERLRRD